MTENNISSTDHAHTILRKLNILRENSNFCDLKIIVGEAIFWAHKNVLCAGSSYFEAMLTSGLSETGKSEIELHEVSEKIAALLLDFIYTGQIKITKDDVQEILMAADMLQFTEVAQKCYTFIEKQLNYSNVIGVFIFAETHNYLTLMNICKNYINRNFLHIIVEDEYLELPLQLVKQVLSSQQLYLDQESQIFEAAIFWILHDPQNRLIHTKDILQAIKMPLISQLYKRNYVKNCFISKLKTQLEDIFINIPDMSKIEPRTCSKRRIFIVGGCNRESRNDGFTMNRFQSFDTFTNEWKLQCPMQLARNGHGSTILNGLLYVAGGKRPCNTVISNTEMYDPVKNQWKAIPEMLSPRTNFGFCSLDGLMYALGGHGTEKSIEVYNPTTRKWTAIETPMASRFAAGVASHDGFIFLVGGLDESYSILGSFEYYTPNIGQWKELPDMITPRAYTGVCVLHGCLYVIGGVRGSWTREEKRGVTTVERYSYQQERWETVASLKVARVSPSVVAIGGCVYVLGGMSSLLVSFGEYITEPFSIDDIEIFDPLVGEWKTSSFKMNKGCGNAAAVVL